MLVTSRNLSWYNHMSDEYRPAITDKFTDDNQNARPSGKDNVGKITRASNLASQRHGSSAGANQESLPPMSDADWENYNYEALTEGLEAYSPSKHGAGSFSNLASHFARHASTNRDIDDVDSLHDEEDIDEVIERRNMRRQSVEDLDNTNEGPGEGHYPVDSPEVGPIKGKFSHKQKVHIASLDCVGVVYDQQGSTITVKANNEFFDVKASDCRLVKANFPNDSVQTFGPGQDQPSATEDAFDGLPRKRTRNDYEPNSRTDDTSMSAFSSLTPAERRAQRRRQADD